MKILLVDVPFDSVDIGGERALFDGVENVIPALGLAYLAAVAERLGHMVAVFEGVFGSSLAELEALTASVQPDVVGFSIMTPTFTHAVRCAERLRAVVPHAVFVAGGSHPTAMPEHTARSGLFELVVQGEGELPFGAILERLASGASVLTDIPGVGVVRDGQLEQGPPGSYVEDLDRLPLPARHLLAPLSRYQPTPASLRRLPLAHVMTSRGCPSRCGFCDRAVFGETYRARSVDDVMGEVDQLVRVYGAREIRFFDDTFTLNRARLMELCDALRRLRPRLPWTCLTRVNCVDRDTLGAMRSAGCWQVLYGLESGDERVLSSLGKGTTLAQNRRAVTAAREAGLRVRADFLVGSPAETMDSLQATLDFALELPIDFAHFNKFVPFPGTRFHRELAEQGHRFDFSESSTLDHDALVYVPPGLEPQAYKDFLDTAYRRFYFRPRYLARRALGLRTLTELWVNTRGARTLGSW
jgi:radical SAM superfamily enzyme YgiQ (UPF0313 family)